MIILGSAGVGAVVSVLGTFLGQWLERRARQRDLLLQMAFELAKERTRVAVQAAEATGDVVWLQDAIMRIPLYYRALEATLAGEALPKELLERDARTRPPNV